MIFIIVESMTHKYFKISALFLVITLTKLLIFVVNTLRTTYGFKMVALSRPPSTNVSLQFFNVKNLLSIIICMTLKLTFSLQLNFHFEHDLNLFL